MRSQLAWFDQLRRWWVVAGRGLAECSMVDFLKHRVAKAPLMKLIARTLMKWQQDECLEMGAALAYYAVFSLFPMILVSLSIVGFLIGPNTVAFNTIISVARDALPPDAFQIVQTTLIQFHAGSTSASIIGFVILLFTASGFFGALSGFFDKIWHVHPSQQPPRGMGAVALKFIWRRLFAFLLVIGASSLIFVSFVSNIALDTFLAVLEGVNSRIEFMTIDQVQLLPSLRLGLAFVILTLVVMVLYKILPSTKVGWRDTWLGALFTTILWLILQQLMSNSVISLGSRFRSYGVVGGVMVLMLWIYLTSQVFLLGGELTYIYAHLFGTRRRGKRLAPELDNPS